MNTSFNILVFDLKKLHIACVHTILAYIRVICYILFYNLLKTKRNSTLLIYLETPFPGIGENFINVFDSY